MKLVFNQSEAAKVMGMCQPSLRKLIKAGTIRTLETPGLACARITRAEVERFLGMPLPDSVANQQGAEPKPKPVATGRPVASKYFP